MNVDKNVAIPMKDGNVLRANVYRPAAGAGRFPVLMAQGVYGKDVHFEDAYSTQWQKLQKLCPTLCSDGSSGRYLRWETVDPERWVPAGYVVIQVDSRGSGQSPGYLDPRSPRENQDFYEAIEWAAAQPWSSGKVGVIGISYYAIAAWKVAALQPPHLAAIVPWEGNTDHYRDGSYHGGILSNTFGTAWWPRQVCVNQHGNGATVHRDRETGEPTTGAPLPAAMLAGNRADPPAEQVLRHPLADRWHKERSPELERVKVPLLSAGNWGGPGIHLRGNIEGFLRAGSKQKWLSMHDGTHYESFYLPQYVALQRRFFDHFLKGADNGWEREPRVQISVRCPGRPSVRRAESDFPLPRTRWTRFYLDPERQLMATQSPPTASSVTYDAMGPGTHFSTAPFPRNTEFTGFVTARLWISSTTTDMDLFLTLRAFDPAGEEVIFDGAHEPVPVARGWLRASHRKVDAHMSRPYRVYHSHDEIQKLTPGELYPVEVEIWPTSIVVPEGYRLVLSVTGKDLEVKDIPGRILHNHPQDRGSSEFSGANTIHAGRHHDSYLLMPLIPPEAQGEPRA
jgi:uncharacterized protein